MHSLPGIKKVSYLPCDKLMPNVMYAAFVGLPVGVYNIPTDITLTGQAECQMEQEPDNNVNSQKVSLTFYTLDDIPEDEPLAFIATTVQGDCYLIGMRERPYPSVKITSQTGTPDGDRAVKKYQVQFTARKALIPCAV